MAIEKTSNAQALSYIDSFLGKVQLEKKAEESPITVTQKQTGGTPAGTAKATEGATEDTSPENTKVEEKAKEGEFSKEKRADTTGAVPGVSVQESAAKNNADSGKGIPAGTVGTTDASGEKAGVKTAEEHQKMASEMYRAAKLADRILNKLAEQAGDPIKNDGWTAVPEGGSPANGNESQAELACEPGKEEEKIASEAEIMMKRAADEAYHDFVMSYQYGMMKRAEDRAALISSIPGMTEKQADEMLDQIALENPEDVMPAEAQAAPEVGAEDAAAGMPPEVDEGAAAVPAEAAAEGEAPTEEDAEKLIQDLIALGVPPEAIEAAANEVTGEEQEVMKAAMEANLPNQQALAKQAAEQFENLKGVIRDFRAGQLR